MNLSVRTIVNHKENQREIVCISSRIWHNSECLRSSYPPQPLNRTLVNIDDPTPPDKLPCTVQTFVRPLDQFPPNFEARAKANGKGTISPAKNERMLLNTLLSAVIPSFMIYNLNKLKSIYLQSRSWRYHRARIPQCLSRCLVTSHERTESRPLVSPGSVQTFQMAVYWEARHKHEISQRSVALWFGKR